MLNESPSALKRVVTSIKVVALATVLGTVVFAAERQLATEVSPEQIVVTDTAVAAKPAPVDAQSGATPSTTVALPQTQAPADYFPSQFAEPKGEPASQPSTF
jgi:hypothetical protein